MADIRGDLIFDGFEPRPSALHCHDGHDLALPPDNAQSIAQVPGPAISSELTVLVGDGRLDACHIPSFWCCLVFASCLHHV